MQKIKNVNGSSRFSSPAGYNTWLDYWEAKSGVYHHYSVPTILQVVTRICFRKKLFYYRF